MLHTAGFSCAKNPFGILFNPYSIALCLEKIATEYRYSAHDFTYHSGEFHSMHHHGSFKNADAGILADHINEKIGQAYDLISQAEIAVITPGTAKVWELREPSMIVGNCHKIPAHKFSSRMLTETEICKAYQDCIYYLKLINPGIKVIFTISPVKHLREGITQNVISKSRLISALSGFIEDHPEIDYFPSFEIQTEELRDYRFYTEDHAHPTLWATEYIFRRFCETRFTDAAQTYIQEARQWLRMKNHKVMSENPSEIAAWKAKCTEMLMQLKTRYPDKAIWPADWN